MRTLTMALVASTMLVACALLKGGMPAPPLTDPNIILAMLDTVNLNELEVAALAKQKASSEEVRMFAARMMQDHAAMRQDLHQLAQRININPEPLVLAAGTRKEHLELMQDLGKRAGPDFDRAYLTSQIVMHEHAIQFLDKTAEVADDPLRLHFRTTLPDLGSHLSAAKDIKRHL